MNASEFKLNLAVIIGINDYQNGIPALGTARQDAEAIATILQTKYHYQVHLLTESQATSQNLKQWLETDLPEAIKTATPSRLLFYFAGHGIALNGDDGPQGYLIPQDAKLGDASTYLPMQQVEEAIAKLSCRHCLVILDCCFAGAFRWSSTRKLIPIAETIHKERYDRFIQDPAWQVITSAASDQYALDNLYLKGDRGIAKNNTNHSPFAAALMAALSGAADAYPPATNGKPAGDGIITATELYLYLRDSVEIPTDAKHQRQTPQIWCLKKHDKGEFIFLPPGHELNLPPAPSLDELEDNNPYRGLKSYETKDSALFFGRTALIDKLCDAMSDRPFTVVLGASGSGKSSLVKAGLIAHLDGSAQTQQAQNQKLKPQEHPHQCKYQTWKILAPIRPGESPLNSLNVALKELGGSETDRVDSQIFTEAIANWTQTHPQTKLLLVVDQLEELITLCRSDRERQQFLNLLADLLKAHPDVLRLVVTLRSDFEPQFRSTSLEPLWQDARFVVPAMTREELRAVIEEPASAKVVYFESLSDRGDLVDRLIDEVAGMPGALPLLSFALSELYLKLARRYLEAQKTGDSVERVITWADYDEVGGVTRSLTQRADREYESLVKQDPAYAQIVQHIMLRMVAVGDELARRRVILVELEYPEPKKRRVQEVLRRFLTARLLVSGQDMEERPYIEPAHDALVRGWQQLLEWKKNEQEYLILQRQLTPAAEEWKHQQKSNFLWNANPRLDLLSQVLESPNTWFNQTEAAFVRRSVNQKRRNMRLRWGLASFAFLALSIFTTAIYIQLQQTDLREKAARAEILLTIDPVDSLVLAIQAIGQNRSRMLWNMQDVVESSLLKATQVSRERSQFVQENRTIDAFALSPDGKAVATISGGYASLWSLEGKLLHEFPKEINDTCDAITFSPDGNTVVCTSILMPYPVKLWDLNGQAVSLPFQQASTTKIATVNYSRDGKKIVTGSEDGKIRIWDRQGKPLTPDFGGRGGRITALAFSSDGSTVASAAEDMQIRLWTTEGKALGALPQLQKSSIKIITFSSNSLKILTTNTNDEVFLWHFQKNAWVGALFEEENFTGFTISAIFTVDGKSIISANRDGNIKIWNLDAKLNKKLITQLMPKHSVQVSGVVLSLDGKLLISGDTNGLIKIWDLQIVDDLTTQFLPSPNLGGKYSSVLISPNGKLIAIEEYRGRDAVIVFRSVKDGQIGQSLAGFNQPLQKSKVGRKIDFGVNLLAFSADDQQIIVGSADGIIRLWDIYGTPKSVVIGGGSQGIYSAALSPNGQRIVTGGIDSNIRLWNLQGKMLNEQKIMHSNATVQIAFSPNGQNIVAGDIAEVCIWSLRQDTLVKLSCKPISKGSATAFSPNSKILIVGDEAGNLHFWNVETNEIQQSFKAHQKRVSSIAFSLDSSKLVSSSEDGSIQLSTIQGKLLGFPLQEQNEFVSSVAFSDDGKKVISARLDGSIKVYQASWASWLKVGCDRLRNHPIFREPRTIEQKEAKITCEQYVWSSE